MRAVNKYEEFKKDNVITYIDPIAFFSLQPVVVSADTSNIASSDAVVFYIQKLSIGTLMELAFSSLGFPSQLRYIITTTSEIAQHPWIRNLVENHREFKQPFGKAFLFDDVDAAAEKMVADLTKKVHTQ